MLLGVGSVSTGLGMGLLPENTEAWEQFIVDYKGCSEVWLVVSKADLQYNPPATAHVIVTSGESTDCILVEFTEERSTTIPGQYGTDPVVKVNAPMGEKILAVIEYNIPYPGDDRFSRPRCPQFNDHRCANTPNVPDYREAICFEAAKEIWQLKGWTCSGPEGGEHTPGRGNRR